MASQGTEKEKDEISFIHCQICLEDMKGRSPRALSCLHTYCEICLVALTKNVSQPNPFNFNVNPFQSNIICPSCRKPTTLGVEGVKGLPVNFMINQFKEEKQKSEALNKQTLCPNCGKNEAAFYCNDCGSPLCNNCAEKHNSIGAFKSHNLIVLKDTKVSKQQCWEHEMEAKYVCLKCESQVCMKCVLSDKHENHSDEIKEFSVWAPAEKNKVACYRETITPIWLDIKERIRKANSLSENISATLKEVKKCAALAREAILEQEEDYARQLLTAKDKNASLIRHLNGLCTNADNFMQASIWTQSSETPNFQSIKAMVSLATCVIDSAACLPKSNELNVKNEFVPCKQWNIGFLKHQSQ